MSRAGLKMEEGRHAIGDIQIASRFGTGVGAEVRVVEFNEA